MKKIVLIAGLSLSTGVATFAQQAPAPATRPTISHTDTVQAIHQVFSKHRTGGWIWTAIGAAFAVRITAASVGSDAASGGAVGVGVFGGIPAAIGIGKLVRFSQGREAAVVNAYDQGQALPNYVSRRLKKSSFAR